MSEPSARTDSDRDQRLGEAVAAYFASIEAGRPSDRAAILAAYPDLAADLAEFFDHEERLGRLIAPIRSTEPADAEPGATTLAELSGPTPGDEPASGESTIGLSKADADGLDGDDDDDPLARGLRVRYFGDYQLGKVLGRGGMGIVYKANQLSLNRLVALKMIRSGHWADDDEVRRFRNEAEAIANLDHPLILPIYEVGRHEDQHYFSMKLVQGGSLENRLGEFQADVRAAAKLVADVALAVHHAHQRGLLHRDLKPSNILLDAENRPHVADFGLAKRIEGDGAASISGSIVGTPSYMSPEQASGRRGSVTTATDVYGLGALLYACLTGGAPFQGDDVVATLRLVTDQPAEPPSKSNSRVDPDLETICLKCLEKDPKRRYDSAAALADDLDRWLRGEPILARRSGTWERVQKWSRRHPARAALVAMSGIAVLTLAGLGVALFIHSQLRSAYAEVSRQRGIAEAALASERTFLYQNRVIFAERALNDNSPDRAEELLDECPPALRNWEWNYLKRQCHTDLLTIPTRQGWVWSVAISSDGRLIATTGANSGSVMLWRADDGELFRTLTGHSTDEGVWCAFSPDGTRIASVSGSVNRPNHLLVHQVATGKEVLRVPVSTSRAGTLVFSPDGRKVVVASGMTEIRADAAGKSTGWVKAYDAETGEERASYETDNNDAFIPSFSPDGNCVMALLGRWTNDDPTGKPNEVRTWDARTSQVRLKMCNENTRALTSARYSPDGRMIATCGLDTTLRLWDARDGRERKVFQGHRGAANYAAFSPNGRRVATTSDDGSARIWDVQTGETLITLRGHRGAFHGVVFSPDGQRLVTSSPDGTVRVWDATTSPEARTITASKSPVRALAFSPDGHRLVTGGFDGALKLWEVPSGRLLATWLGHTQAVWDVAFSPDMTRVASAAGDWMKSDQVGEVHIWDVTTGRVLHPLRAHQAVAWRVRFSPDGRRLVSTGGEISKLGQEIIFWDAITGAKQRTISIPEGGAPGLALSRDGRRIAASMRNVIRTWDAETGESNARLEQPSVDTISLDFSVDGRTLFSTTAVGTVGVWDVGSGQLLKTIRTDKFMTNAVVLNPAGTRVATVGTDYTVKLWDAATYQQVITLHGHAVGSHGVYGVAFSPDGHWVAASDDFGVLKLWDGSPWKGGAQ